MAVAIPPVPIVASDLNILFEGDSMTVGFNAAGGFSYPAQLLRLLPRLYPSRRKNVATNGHTLTQMTAEQATTDLEYDGTKAMNIMVLWGGTNDMADAIVTGTTCHTRLNTYCTSRKTTGWKIVVLTCLPRSAGGESAGFETERQSYNTLIRSNYASYAHALADVAAISSLGDAGVEANAINFADRLHLTAAGHSLVAKVVRDAIATLNPPCVTRAETVQTICGS
jgi:lysophospholipase L1-like esterase